MISSLILGKPSSIVGEKGNVVWKNEQTPMDKDNFEKHA